MRQGTLFLLSAYFLLASLCLPGQDLSALPALPDVYRHCQATEDRDMTPWDFITDHLVNIDRLADKHPPGDHQKPHHPKQVSHGGHQQIFVNPLFRISLRLNFFERVCAWNLPEPVFHSGFPSGIFHPPKPQREPSRS
jgi:hypothetical protein